MDAVEFAVQACFVDTVEDVETFAVILGDHPDEPLEWLELQRSLSIDEQDEELGMDTYCLVRSGGAAHYGGVKACHLNRDILTLHLDREAAAALETPTFHLQLNLTDEAFQELQNGLLTIFAD
ncbi:hypothetical protein QR90_14800 [Deinococcus radiopugnans]|uniref:Immunity protein 10 n=1 Tax=Deinococcus radiopugnans TaxID=57497 RepID=A0A0A7KIU6_9DEIO|nr:Imm10 family immunity protein [Deinococcus radiopugnans]AIZ46066.1 hypothetical protein QR90_14800 [Deinococcus radiopugnans]